MTGKFGRAAGGVCATSLPLLRTGMASDGDFFRGNPLPASIKDFIRHETSVHSPTVVYMYAWMEVGNSVFIPCLIYLGSTRLNILKEPSRRKEEDPIHFFSVFLWESLVRMLEDRLRDV